MKQIDVEEDLYRYIASQTQDIGESASQILRRLLGFEAATSTSIKQTDTAAMPVKAELSFLSSEHVETESLSSVFEVTPTTELLPITKKEQDQRLQLIQQQPLATTRFIELLSYLYQLSPEHFYTCVPMRGKTRIYIADSKAIILEASQQSKPRPIPNSPMFVDTNNNTKRKQLIVQQLLKQLKLEQMLQEEIYTII